VVEGEVVGAPQYESDRARLSGRGRTVGLAAAMGRRHRAVEHRSARCWTLGVQMRRAWRVAARAGRAQSRSGTAGAASRAELCCTWWTGYHDRNAPSCGPRTLALDPGKVQLRHIGREGGEGGGTFQRLGCATCLYADPAWRAPSEAIVAGAGRAVAAVPHSSLRATCRSCCCDREIEDIAQVRQLPGAHEYWRMKRLAVDLVIVNERAASYVQDLQIAIETAVRSSQSRPRFGAEPAQGSVYACGPT
jgi:cyclic beta-1,2-glucan synthetase